MRLCELLPGCDLQTEVTGLVDDSTKVCPGDLFFALAGSRVHGLAFAHQAEQAGAVAVAYDPKDGSPTEGLTVPCIAVPDLDVKMGEIASHFYGRPSHEMEVIGITGTNGKTSCSFFLAQALGGAVIGTLGWGRWSNLKPTRHTTAPALETHRRLYALRSQGVNTVAMEVSSHALAQERVNGVAFDVAVWTNLSRDHLDYHGSLKQYASVKRRFLSWPGLKAAVVNLDDPGWKEFSHGLTIPLFGFGWQQAVATEFPQLRVLAVRFHPGSIEFEARLGADRVAVRMALVGESNLANVLAVMTTLIARGLSLSEAALRVTRLEPVPGRMECFQHPGRPVVVVDYAHTPAALEMALRSLRRHASGKLWVVFGCGGERDQGKRPQMGVVAEKFADGIILTDDNPRHEDPERIIEQVVAGMRQPPQVIRHREAAIATALELGQADDIVLVAGKGHETYQEVAGERRPCCDRALVASLLGEVATCV